MLIFITLKYWCHHWDHLQSVHHIFLGYWQGNLIEQALEVGIESGRKRSSAEGGMIHKDSSPAINLWCVCNSVSIIQCGRDELVPKGCYSQAEKEPQNNHCCNSACFLLIFRCHLKRSKSWSYLDKSQMVLLYSPVMERLEFSASGINPQFFSHLICNKLKGFVPSVSAKVAQTSGLQMSVLGLIMNFNQCFLSLF